MAQQVLSITQINEYIRGKMDSDALLNQVAVKGEISNYKRYPSGHHYFTLKDENAALKAVMFKGNAMRLHFQPENVWQHKPDAPHLRQLPSPPMPLHSSQPEPL